MCERDCKLANEREGFGYRKQQEEVVVVSGGFLIHLPHNHNLAKTHARTHTHSNETTRPLSFLLFSLRMSYSSVAIGYLAIQLLMSITSSLFILCGKQQDWSSDQKSLPHCLLFSKKRKTDRGFVWDVGLILFALSTGGWPYNFFREQLLFAVASLYITSIVIPHNCNFLPYQHRHIIYLLILCVCLCVWDREREREEEEWRDM